MVAAIPKAGPFTTPEMEQIDSCQPEMEFLKGIFLRFLGRLEILSGYLASFFRSKK
jgi:hypothetical protein